VKRSCQLQLSTCTQREQQQLAGYSCSMLASVLGTLTTRDSGYLQQDPAAIGSITSA
jgi:hypothetical protein